MYTWVGLMALWGHWFVLTIARISLRECSGPKKGRLFEVCRVSSLLATLLGLLGQKDSLDVGQDTSLGDGDTGQKFVQLLVVADGELQVTGDDPRLLVVAGGVACQFENLSCQVLEDGSQVHWGTSSNSLGVVAFPQQTVDSAHWELKSSPG